MTRHRCPGCDVSVVVRGSSSRVFHECAKRNYRLTEFVRVPSEIAG